MGDESSGDMGGGKMPKTFWDDNSQPSDRIIIRRTIAGSQVVRGGEPFVILSF